MNASMIPKIIHYIWVGPSGMGKVQNHCIESWKKYLSGYEFKFWNERNSPMDNDYVREMYKKRKWAFVSDYIRFKVLENYGGIYLDTDTEILKPMDDLLSQNAFFGKTKDGFIAAGVIGAVPHHKVITDILRVYDNDKKPTTERTSPKTVTQVLNGGNYDGITVYDYRYFNPCDDGEKCTPDKLSLAYANNHWAESWVRFSWLRKALRRLGLMNLVKKIFKK